MPTIRKRNGRFQAQVRIKRNGVIVHEDSATFDTEPQAKHWGKTVEANFRSGAHKVLSQRVTLHELIRLWVVSKEAIDKRTIGKGLQHSANALMTAPFAVKEIGDITAKDITMWGVEKAKTLSPSTVLHHIMVMRSAYRSAPSLLNIYPPLEPLNEASSTLQRMRVTGKSVSRTQRIDDPTLELIANRLREKALLVPSDVYVRLAVVLPRRLGEICEMLWSDYTGDTITLRDTKSPIARRDEVIPVPAEAKAIIDKIVHIPGEDRIFPYKPESISAAFQRAVRELGLTDIRLHDLRHEGISRLFEAGLQIQEVALISGHVSWAALKRYTHIQPYKVLEKLNASSKRAQEATAQPE